VEAFAARWERLPLFAGVRALPSQEQAVLRARRVAHTAEGLAWALRALGTGMQPSQWSRLGGLLVPVLLVTGSRDLKFTRIARAMAARLPSCQNVELPGVFHVPHLEAPAAWANAVSTFLS
jgi:2-succinyl-6-hydroxy-2,4-cyclohexadiene-1-carboxylate synthase